MVRDRIRDGINVSNELLYANSCSGAPEGEISRHISKQHQMRPASCGKKRTKEALCRPGAQYARREINDDDIAAMNHR